MEAFNLTSSAPRSFISQVQVAGQEGGKFASFHCQLQQWVGTGNSLKLTIRKAIRLSGKINSSVKEIGI